jgi:6-phosphofructokinase 1
MKKTKCIGILTAGGDCPGLNSAIRGVAKAAMHYGIKVIGIQDGFRGLVENRWIPLESKEVSGILTRGGTILGSSRDKPQKMDMGGKMMDMTHVAITNAARMQIDCLVCLGGNGTQKNAMHLAKEGGLNVITLPKTIDNDIFGTDVSFGFDTAMNIATDAIDRLHTTATSHHRIIVCEVMGHNAGWLALGSGIAGGADVILIPEIPYDLKVVAEHVDQRRRTGRRFSIIAVAEGAMSIEEAARKQVQDVPTPELGSKKKKKKEAPVEVINEEGERMVRESMASRIARDIQNLTGIDARVTSLGHVLRGGTPSAADRLLCSRLGTCTSQLLLKSRYNCMIAVRGTECVPVPLEEIAGIKKVVPINHPWLDTARFVDTCLGR